MTVYADVLFLINFSMDLLTLTISGKIMNRRLVKYRILLASLIGGLFGTVINLMPESMEWKIFFTVCGIAMSFIMTLIAFGWGGAARLFRDSAIIWGNESIKVKCVKTSM